MLKKFDRYQLQFKVKNCSFLYIYMILEKRERKWTKYKMGKKVEAFAEASFFSGDITKKDSILIFICAFGITGFYISMNNDVAFSIFVSR